MKGFEKRKVFFLLSSMNVGGVEKSFLRLISTLAINEYEIHLGLLRLSGGLLSMVPPYVITHRISAYDSCWQVINNPPKHTIAQSFRNGHLGRATAYLLLFGLRKLSRSSYWLFKYLLKDEPVLEDSFDIAIAYAGPSQMIDYYICEKVRADVKYGWVHFDISRFGIDKGMTRRLYKQYDKIFVVSNEAKNIFVNYFPELEQKTVVRYNVVDPGLIRSLSENAPTFNDGFYGTRILTVGRISKEKGQRLAISSLKYLIDYPHPFRWYFVGEGRDLAACRELAQKENVNCFVEFLGVQLNPYGYMRDCDIYVQPSFHEGFCITLAEALCFNKPIVATCFSGAKEQLEGKPDSFIVDFSEKSIADAILHILDKKVSSHTNG